MGPLPPVTSPLTLTSHSAAETRRLGRDLGRLARPGDVFLLIGSLGAGKTWLAQGIAQGLEVAEAAISPTFVLVREYQGRLPLFHVDLYRLETEAEVAALGLEDYLYGAGACVVEWADRAVTLMPPDNMTIRIEHVSPRRRKLHLQARGERYERLLADLKLAGWGKLCTDTALNTPRDADSNGAATDVELSIDTATDWASLALSRQGDLVAEMTWHCGQKHLVELFPNIRSLLSVARIQTRDLTALNVCRGPGSFNGVRVGVSAAKGLALALNIPVVGVSTLEVEAFAHAPSGLPVCPVQEAGRGEVATAMFQQREAGWQRLWDDQLLTPDALARRTTRRTVFCGQIRPELQALLESGLGRKAIVVSGSVRRAGYLARLGWQVHSEGKAEDAATLQALYLRPPAITQRQKP